MNIRLLPVRIGNTGPQHVGRGHIPAATPASVTATSAKYCRPTALSGHTEREHFPAATAIGFTAADQQGRCEFNAIKSDGTPHKLMNVGRLNSMVWKAFTPMQTGLARANPDFIDRYQ